MFGKQLIPYPVVEHKTEYVTRDVHIHAAPTDESVKMFNELKKAAEQSILEAVRVQDTKIDCVVHIAREMISTSYIYKAICTVNGERIVATYIHDPIQAHVRSMDDMSIAFTGLCGALAHEMVSKILSNAFTAAYDRIK